MLVEILQSAPDRPDSWQQFEVSDVDSFGDAAYWVVRSQHPELTDDNHTYEAERVHEIVVEGEVHRWRQVSIFHKRLRQAGGNYEWAGYWFGAKYREVQS